jgi:hypothetical protein
MGLPWQQRRWSTGEEASMAKQAFYIMMGGMNDAIAYG